MADYRTEEEQIELLKRWWQENGKATVAGVVIALSGYACWMGWTSHRASVIGSAADVYQEMLLAVELPGSDTKVAELAERLRKEYPETVYGVFASLSLARSAVNGGDLPRAIEYLLWAQEHNVDPSLKPLIAVRMAQVYYAQAEYDKALEVLSVAKGSDAWLAAAAELRGDIQLAQGKIDEARVSYGESLKALESSAGQERRADVEMKLSDLAAPAATPVAVQGDRS